MSSYLAEITGRVIAGDRRGRTIGFPTANLVPRPEDDLPAAGVYAGLANGRPAAVNIGTRPTFAGATPGLVVEVYILDFSGDLYGHALTVRFVTRLRDELRFDGVDALIEQLHRDVEAVRATFSESRPTPSAPRTAS